ncbi:MAG: putative small protein [Ramlibacter sp.]|nr:putative small protein [Ramlibacter sp.]
MKQGDKVRLATGGPVMTVEMAPVHMAFVTWSMDDRKYRSLYPQEDLVLVEAVHEESVQSIDD